MKKTELRPSAEDLRAKMYVDGKIVISTDNLPGKYLPLSFFFFFSFLSLARLLPFRSFSRPAFAVRPSP